MTNYLNIIKHMMTNLFEGYIGKASVVYLYSSKVMKRNITNMCRCSDLDMKMWRACEIDEILVSPCKFQINYVSSTNKLENRIE